MSTYDRWYIAAAFIVPLLLASVVILFAVRADDAFDRACRDRGGNPVHGRNISLCLDPGATR